MLRSLSYHLTNVTIRRHSGWRKIRDAHISFQPECQFCFCMKGTNHVHHILPVHLAPELELDRTNLITLCPDCHFVVGHFGDWLEFNPDVRALCDLYGYSAVSEGSTE